jgi:signal transduction histidine kinase
MDIISSDHIWKIQRFTAVVSLILAVAAVLINLLGSNNSLQKVINISVIGLMILVLAVSLLFNNKYMRCFQVTIFIAVGVFTILFDANNRFIGDILFITGVLLAYTYRLLNTYSYKTMGIIIISMIILRVVSGIFIPTVDAVEEIVVAVVSVTLILFLTTLLKNELIWYVKESRKNDIYIYAGMNIIGFAHGLNLGTAINLSRTIKRKIQQHDHIKAFRFAGRLESYLLRKNRLLDNLLFAVNQSRMTVKQEVDICKTLEAVLDVIRLNKEVVRKIKVCYHTAAEQLLISAVPFELYFILQNIITNAVEAMLRIEKRHVLKICFNRIMNNVCLVISDTGPGFDKEVIDKRFDFKKIQSIKNAPGGFGLLYASSLMKHNNIKSEFRNKQEGGVEVKLTFRMIGVKDV